MDGVTNIQSDEDDGVNLSNGEYTYSHDFMHIPGTKMSYDFELTYHSQASYDGPVGNNFDHNYNIFLTAESGSTEESGSVNLYDGKLGMYNFTSSGSWYNP